MKKILTPNFFNRPVLAVARELLGKFLVRRLKGGEISLMITEVEAYDGQQDKASHASRGKTGRNKIMFGKAGNWYVYFTYGMHWILNVVTGPEDYPAAVLMRRAEGIKGPARLAKYLKIDKRFNGLPSNKKAGLWIEDRGVKINHPQIKRAKRIGVDYAGKWAEKLYRFYLEVI
jgi:DNA-3-methyladenine glycosylase